MPKSTLRRALALVALLSCSACQFLQNEFATLNKTPPSVRQPATPAAQPW